MTDLWEKMFKGWTCLCIKNIIVSYHRIPNNLVGKQNATTFTKSVIMMQFNE